MIFRKVSPNEYKSIAAIHKLAFGEFFLTSLGLSFLESYYKACINNKNSIAVCAVDENNEIKGFATGSLHAKAYHSKLFIRNLHSFAYRAFVIALTNPYALIRLINNLDKNTDKKDDRNYSELLSIAVLPELMGSGTAKGLLRYYENEALNRGADHVALTTDYDNNYRVISFYNKSGYRIYYDFITYPNRRMYKMIKDLGYTR